MNLFFLHHDPKICAMYHCDKHVVKMLLEVVQMLYTAHILHKTTNLPPDHYKISYQKHPTSIWIRTHVNNYIFASQLAVHLAEEYTHRYGKIHSCEHHARWLKDNIPECKETKYADTVTLSFFDERYTPVPLCMPDDCKITSNDTYFTIMCYRIYYNRYKKYFAKWKKRYEPYWFYTQKSIREIA